jgi:hypothetical protein
MRARRDPSKIFSLNKTFQVHNMWMSRNSKWAKVRGTTF